MFTLSPLDNRYKHETKSLRPFFSEFTLIRYRVLIEIEYLIALSLEKGVEELKPFSEEEQNSLRDVYKTCTKSHALRIKEIEQTTKHDVKAIEYFLQEKLELLQLDHAIPFLHFALTSEDINNIAYTLMWKHGLEKIYIPQCTQLIDTLSTQAKKYANLPMLAMTHGQPASPTTVGKEFAVYLHRLNRQLSQLKNQQFEAKLNGATGTWGAHMSAYPKVDWINFSTSFLNKFGLTQQILSTQVNSYDSLAESYHTLTRINTILTDLSRNIWLYISRGIFVQEKRNGEVGSSTMPHKINPIDFENAEGNLGIANSYFNHLALTLPISRMQRDLSGSTVIRNQGIPLAHSLLACKSLVKGLHKISPSVEKLYKELTEHWELLAEPIQTVLRKYGYIDAYEQLKILSRGNKITRENLVDFIQTLKIPDEAKRELRALSPDTYIGKSSELLKNLPIIFQID